MGHRLFFRVRNIHLSALLLSISVLSAAPNSHKPDFSGLYAGGKGSLMEVVQTAAAIKVTVTAYGEAVTNTFRLDGSEGPYTAGEGRKGIGTARWKGRTLIILAHWNSPTGEGGAEREFSLHEQWFLSQDSKALRIEKFIGRQGILGGADLTVGWSKKQLK